MNILLIFFALPIATIIISIALQKIFKCPPLVAAIIFAIFPFIGKKHYMSKANGIFFVLIYAIYIIYSINVAI